MSRGGKGATPDGAFRFEYDPGVLRYGSVAGLDEELAALEADRALVVCGGTVGTTPEVIDPVRDGLGERLAGVFAETTPEKRLATAIEGFDAMRARDADALVGLGGGSSLDVAKIIAVLAAGNRDPEAIGRELAETGSIRVPEGSLPPIVAVPTTLAGADLSAVAGVTAAPASGLVPAPASGGVSDPRLMPGAVIYDPALFATTPGSVLRGSAMNGFDKGIETLYARTATPVTDATAMRGLRLLREGLPALGTEGASEDTLGLVLRGTMLVQYGISRPGETTLSVIHAFGHGLREHGLRQGVAHAVVAPAVLSYLFDRAPARRDLLAEALAVGDAPDAAEAVVESVASLRDALDLPSRLRDVDGPDQGDFPEVTERILDDRFMENAPPELDPTAAEIEGVLRDAW